MKRIVLFSVDQNVGDYLFATFQKIIGSVAEIFNVTMEAGNFEVPEPEVVFVSGEFLRPKARALFPGIRIIVPDRVIVGQNLEQVLLLPKGADVLVVNSPRQASEQTIENLKKLELDHLNYIPYWKGRQLDLDRVHTAISPGMMHLCPEAIANRIDIGPRNVSINSFLEVLQALELDIRYLDRFSEHYHRLLLDSSRRLAFTLRDMARIRRLEDVVVNEFEEGILYVNAGGRIDLVNKAAARLMNIPRQEMISMDIQEVLGRFEQLAAILEESGGKTAHIYNLNGTKTVVGTIPVDWETSRTWIYTLRRIEVIEKLEKEVRTRLVEKGHVTKYSFSNIWTRNSKVKTVIEKARDFSATGKNILITAESGMGKELFAHAIHQASPFRNGPFVAVNFAGIPENLIESELFGYEDGAFTGARKGGRKGLFEHARGGTLFLDEIGDAPLSVQASLLRVLQEKEVLRVGGSSIIPVEVRIVAATNKDIPRAIRAETFRNDLFYRLNTFPITVPPLREHKEDVLYIMKKYFKRRYGLSKTVSDAARDCLMAHDWPGNVRELINIAEYVFFTSKTCPEILPEHLPDTMGTAVIPPETVDRSPEDFMHIEQVFFENGLPPDLTFRLLDLIRESRGKLCGRSSLRRKLLYAQFPVSEGKIKKALTLFREAGLVLVGKTKQGTSITPRGRAFLDHMAKGKDLAEGNWEN